MTKQLNYKEFKEKQKNFKNSIIYILENFEHEENVGSAFRLADAFNVSKIIIVSNKEVSQRMIRKTSRSCENFVDFKVVDSIENAIAIAKEASFTPVSVEICTDSKPLRDVDFSQFGGTALILGNEKHGVSQTALDNSACTVHIEMFGNNSSMNVVTVLAIATYKATEDYLKKSFKGD